jgi:hypothetical protein
MALITNNISGSSADAWKIGITGSVIFGNPGPGTFPSNPGTDSSFFVSGSIGGKGTSGTAIFGGDAVVSGSLTVGTGSITITSNEIQFLGGAAKITSGSGGLTFFDSGNSGGVTLTSLTAGAGGGDVDGPASATDNAIARFDGLTGKLIQDTSGVTIDDTNNVVTSGSFVTKNGSGLQVVSLGNDGVISGSSDLQAGGNLTVAGTSTLVGIVSASSDLAVNGGDITTTAATATLFNTSATTVNIGGAATAVAIGSSTGTTTVNNSLTVKGDLYISGTVTTIDSTVTEIQDPVIGLGFSSGSIALSAGDRGFIGGITGDGNNVAFVWSNSNSSFVATKTTSSPTGSVATAVSVTALQPVRAARFDVGGTTAFVSSSDGTSLLAQASGPVTVNSTASKITLNPASNQPIEFQIGGSSHAELTGSAGAAKFGAVGGKSLILSGAAVDLDSTTGVNFDVNGIQAGSVTGIPSTSLTLFARDGGAGSIARNLVLTGSGVTIGSHGGSTSFAFAGAAAVGTATSANGFTLGSAAGSNLNLSGSSNFLMRHGDTGVGFQKHAQPYLTINSSSVSLSSNAALITADSGKAMVVGGTSTTIVSGSAVYLNIAKGVTGQGAFFRADSDNIFTVQSGTIGGSLILGSGPTITRADLLNSDVTTINFAGVSTTLSIASTTTSTQTVNLGTASTGSSTYNLGTGATAASTTKTINIGTGGASNSTTNINIGSTSGAGTITVNENMLPGADVAYDLGSPSFRWRNMYTGDLHLRNDRGDWTIIEERDFLSITNNHSGKRYKFVIEEI